uniref:Heat shock protein 75 kDa, mitochondrial n=1 Tax=Timema shepardi TaxID=629360 RepID=A0A7R9B994_TIMSH|nr:unnamed protein product [Timema shepardi]
MSRTSLSCYPSGLCAERSSMMALKSRTSLCPWFYGYEGLFEMNRESDVGVALYSRKVLIKSKTDNILPKWLRFVKGVVDSEDIPLNLSRELLQNSALIRKLQTVLTNRLLRFLHDKSTKEPEQFDLFYKDYSPFLKEGIVMSQQQLEKALKWPLSRNNEGFERRRWVIPPLVSPFLPTLNPATRKSTSHALMGSSTNGTSARTRPDSPSGPVFQEEIAKLLRFESSRCSPGERVSLPQYIGRLAEGQKDVFYLAAPSNLTRQLECQQCTAQYVGLATETLRKRRNEHRHDTRIKNPEKPVSAHASARNLNFEDCHTVKVRALAEASPYYEALRRKDVEVLFCSEPYDELVLMQLRQFDSHNLTSVEKEMRQDKEKDDLTTLGTVQSQPDLSRYSHNLTSVEKEMRQDKEKDDLTTLGGESLLRPEVENLLPWLKKCLGGKVHAVKVTRRLDSHPCVITVEDMGAARHFLRMQSHQLTEENRYALLQPQLEINPSHPIIKKLSKLVTSNPRLAELVSQQLANAPVVLSSTPEDGEIEVRVSLLANAMVSAGLVEDPRTLVTSLNELLSMALEAH